MQIQTIKVGVANCYLIRDDGIILIDAGSPDGFVDFSKGMQKIGISPKEISAVVITHCHWDHIGCAKAIKECTNAKIIVHENEKNILEEGKSLMPHGVTFWGNVLSFLLVRWNQIFSIEPIEPCEVDTTVDNSSKSLSEFGINGKIVFTPGHSLGSVSVVLDSGHAFVGDMAMNAFPMTIKPSLPIFAEDVPALKQSWKKLIEMGVKIIHPGHGEPFPVEKLLSNKSFDWYQNSDENDQRCPQQK